jgi:hypothetical protein
MILVKSQQVSRASLKPLMRIDPPAGNAPRIGRGVQSHVDLADDRPRLAALGELERGKPHSAIGTGQPDQPPVVGIGVPAAHLIGGQ